VLRGRFFPTVHAAVLGVFALTSVARAENTPSAGTIHEIPLRGGLHAALNVFGDRLAGDRGLFLLEVIRRVYDSPITVQKNTREALLQTLLAHLDRAPASADPSETVPLPLSPAIWNETVFNGTADTGTLVTAILRSRNASLLYAGLLSLDDSTRAWLATQPQLLKELATVHAPSLVIAADALRVEGNVVRVPGGEAAEPAWRTLVGKEPREAAGFIRAMLTLDEGRLAYFYGAMAQLTPAQLRFALRLDAKDPADRVDAVRRLFDVFGRVGGIWKVAERAFWRPTLDPALLAADLAQEADGSPHLPGTRAFWTAAFDAGAQGRPTPASAAKALAGGEPADFPWLCDQIFKGGAVAQRQPYEMVLFASRVIKRITPENVQDALDSVHAVATYPALVTVLERARVTDPAVYGIAARRAGQLAGIGDVEKQRRLLGQFQGSIAILTRAAIRKSLSTDAVSALIASLSAVELSERQEYEGGIARWWVEAINAHGRTGQNPPGGAADWIGDPSTQRYHDAVSPLDREVVRLLAGAVPAEPTLIDWEGTRYRVDPSWAEGTRLGKLLGDRARPYLSSAAALAEVAEALTASRSTAKEQIAKAARALQAIEWQEADKVLAPLRRAAEEVRPSKNAGAVVAPLQVLADDLLGRGLIELAYAVAFGRADRSLIESADAAARHDFGLRLFGRLGAWRFPVAGSDRMRDWRVTGSLLGLDVRLAEFSLVRVSSRPPSVRPTINDADRRVLIEAVALVEAASLNDADRDRIVASIQKGRARLGAARTPELATALADEIRITGARRSLLAWVAEHDPARLGAWLSPIELFWLGLEANPVAPALHGWGAPAEPRLGCLCLHLPARRPLDALTGRWESGIFASGFADLNLRLAEMLGDLHMPAVLLASVLPPATADLIDTAVNRGPDDRRGLVEFVQGLQLDRMELYLALLTTDGPLVALGETPEPAAGRTVRKTEVSR
jgi:hypothetical protein